MIQVTNTLTGKKEHFTPMEPGTVKMYVCGPTVYNFVHIGNARPLVFFDVVARYFKFSGLKVIRVMNYTDVDDKILHRANEEKTTPQELSEKYIQEFERDMILLNVEKPDMQPKVSAHIPEIIHLIERLIENKLAYVAEDGEVFFSVRSFPEYGKLSKKRVDDLLVGARVAPDEKKKDPLDFSLWKPKKPGEDLAWSSPWGAGRPGWHIECSAMAIKYLGESFDIHGGGMDLIHPHHENEIAQSEGSTGRPFAKYWLHNNMLTIQSEKMSKSVGNIWLTRDFIERFTAETLKLFLLSGHYRSTLDFSQSQIKETQAALHRIYKTLEKCKRLTDLTTALSQPLSTEGNQVLKFSNSFEASWTEAMDDDFNTAKVIGLVFEYVRLMNGFLDKKTFQYSLEASDLVHRFLNQLGVLGSVLNILNESPSHYLTVLRNHFLNEKNITEAEIEELISKRIEARQNKNYALSDNIRNELLSKGIELMDRDSKTTWDVKFTG